MLKSGNGIYNIIFDSFFDKASLGIGNYFSATIYLMIVSLTNGIFVYMILWSVSLYKKLNKELKKHEIILCNKSNDEKIVDLNKITSEPDDIVEYASLSFV